MLTNRARLITFNALLCAFVLAFVLFPIKIGPLSLAFLPIIAVVLAGELISFKNALFTGLFFGVVSLCNHLINPSALSPAFWNPMVSIVPRVLIGVTSYFTSKGMRKLVPSIPYAAYTAAGGVAALTNTVGVLGMILAFNYGKTYGATLVGWQFIAVTVGTLSILEFAVCLVVIPPVVTALKKYLKLDEEKTDGGAEAQNGG